MSDSMKNALETDDTDISTDPAAIRFLLTLVQDKVLSVKDAAARLNLTPAEFATKARALAQKVK